MKDWTNVLSDSVVSDLTAGHNCQNLKNPDQQSATCFNSDNRLSMMTPGSQADFTTLTRVDKTGMSVILTSFTRLPGYNVHRKSEHMG